MITEGRVCPTSDTLQALRILFITLEFRAGTFSGNGVYATAQVRALAAAGHKVFVVSAQPLHAKASEDDYGVAGINEIPVSSWHRLDAGAPWREFAAGVLEPAVTEAVRAFAPDVVLAVDWSALQAVRHLAPYCNGAPYVYLNYRVFTRTAVGDDLELIRGMEAAAMAESLLTVALSRSDAEYLETHVAPGGAVAAAAGPAATAEEGQQQQQQCGGQQQQAGQLAGRPVRKVVVLLPALREDVRQLAPPADLMELAASWEQGAGRAGASRGGGGGAEVESRGSEGVPRLQQQQEQEQAAAAVAAHVGAAVTKVEVQRKAEGFLRDRPYLSCVVRLSPEKEPERFVELVEGLAAAGLLTQHGVTPLLLGVASDEYAQGLKARLRAAAPDCIILERFMGPEDLAAVYRRTRLNFHPSTYDAYGMTIVEAASQGAPSVVHDGDGAVGATDLLHGSPAGQGEAFLLDLRQPPSELAAAVGRLLGDAEALAATAVRALHKARSWDEAANAADLVRLVRGAMGQAGTALAAP